MKIQNFKICQFWWGFERMDANEISGSAQNIHWSGGPFRIDADTWKNMICSKTHGSKSLQPAEEIAMLFSQGKYEPRSSPLIMFRPCWNRKNFN